MDHYGGDFVGALEREESSFEARLGEEGFKALGVSKGEDVVVGAVAHEELDAGARGDFFFPLSFVENGTRKNHEALGVLGSVESEIHGKHTALAEASEENLIPAHAEFRDHLHRFFARAGKSCGGFSAHVVVTAAGLAGHQLIDVEGPPRAARPSGTNGDFLNALRKKKIQRFLCRDEIHEARKIVGVRAVAVKKDEPRSLGII